MSLNKDGNCFSDQERVAASEEVAQAGGGKESLAGRLEVVMLAMACSSQQLALEKQTR